MGNNSAFLKNSIQQLNILFSLKNLGPVYYFIGLEIFCDKFGFYLSQREYILDLLRKFDKYDCAPVSTPMVANKHFFAQEGKSLAGPSIYRRAISSLQYLTSTRLDISTNRVNFCLILKTSTFRVLREFSDISKELMITTFGSNPL